MQLFVITVEDNGDYKLHGVDADYAAHLTGDSRIVSDLLSEGSLLDVGMLGVDVTTAAELSL